MHFSLTCTRLRFRSVADLCDINVFALVLGVSLRGFCAVDGHVDYVQSDEGKRCRQTRA